VTAFLAHHGVWAVFVLMFVDAVFPAASELVMVYGGALASGALGYKLQLFGSDLDSGFVSYVVISLAGTIGYLAGAVVGWGIGLYGGRPFLERRGRWFHLDHDRLERAERWFERWGDLAVLVGRVTPVVRSFVSIPAGVFEMPLPRYVWWTAIGSAIWCFGLAAAGWALGASWEHFHHAFRYADVVIALTVAGLGVWLFLRWRRSRGVRETPVAPDARRP
jgi:membrane protein DedA with SNARE-associated domain